MRGVGLVLGLACKRPRIAERIATRAFVNGLLIETAGPEDEVLKLLPPLTIEDAVLDEGLERLAESTAEVAREVSRMPTTAEATP